MSRPRVLVVRSGANPFASFGGSARVEIVEKVSHSIEPVDPEPEAFAGPAELVVFTSQVAVERVFADARLAALVKDALAGGRLAAVGAVTAEALRSCGLEPELVAGGSAEDVLDLLPPALDGWRVLLPCGADASEELPERLRQRGAHVSRAVVYRKEPRPPDAELGRQVIERPFAAFCTTSPSAARWLLEGLAAGAAERLRHTPAVVLGRFTRRFLEAHGIERIETTGEPRFAAAVRLLEELATAPAGA